MHHRRLGLSELEVSRLALGSWRTFERLTRDQGLAVMRAAREHGITFLDDARYDDETGEAPLSSGYSEVLFGELFRAAGWERTQTVVSNKLWWEFWPGEDAAAELDGSLQRMGFEYIDLIYANPPPDGLAITDMVSAVGELITSGRARAWGIVNWEAEPLLEAAAAAERQGVPQPCAAQLPYSFVQRDWVESDAMAAALEASGAGVVASFVMAGGILTGKYDAGGRGRADRDVDTPRFLTPARSGGACAGQPKSSATAPLRSRSRLRSPTPAWPVCCSAPRRPGRSPRTRARWRSIRSSPQRSCSAPTLM
jgi:aryl-alcohol dehydrogenase-like predicted oxidoreductase